jgi:hypothetical protein
MSTDMDEVCDNCQEQLDAGQIGLCDTCQNAKKDWNVAEREHRLFNNPTDADCYDTGIIHKAYGWSSNPIGLTDAQKQLYRRGYDGMAMDDQKDEC